MYCIKKTTLLLTVLCLAVFTFAENSELVTPDKTGEQKKLESIELEEKKVSEEEILAEPTETIAEFKVRKIEITGNTILSTEEICEDIPLTYVANAAIGEKDAQEINLEAFSKLCATEGEEIVSAQEIQGFTRYILDKYQTAGYAGIYVYVPADTVINGVALKDDTLTIDVIEATISDLSIAAYDPNNVAQETSRLKESYIMDWSPAEVGKPVEGKKLDEFVNLLNENPDRYVSAIISTGAEDETLAVKYNIYEADPMHWFAQVDNSGTKDRQWTPKIGMVNTNVLGYDDTLTVVYQAPWEKGIEDRYSIFGSYDFPVYGPKLRLNVYGGYSQFDIGPQGDNVSFLGNGSFIGSILTYKALQHDDWFFDVFGKLSYEESRTTPSYFGVVINDYDLEMALWGAGVKLHRDTDMTSTSLVLEFEKSFNTSGAADFIASRAGAETDFTIYTASFNHNQYMDEDKIGKIRLSSRFTTSNERLTPSKMMSFGGMYTVRGYDESEVVADGGLLASLQYEYDMIAAQKAKLGSTKDDKKEGLRKFAPIGFIDYGKSRNQDSRTVASENTDIELLSIGGGLNIEFDDTFSSSISYGYPLINTDDTRTGKGRLHVSFLARW